MLVKDYVVSVKLKKKFLFIFLMGPLGAYFFIVKSQKMHYLSSFDSQHFFSLLLITTPQNIQFLYLKRSDGKPKL